MLVSFMRDECFVTKEINCTQCKQKAEIFFWGYADVPEDQTGDVSLCLECSKEFVRRINHDIWRLDTKKGREREANRPQGEMKRSAESMLLSFYRDKHGADEKIQPLLDYLGEQHPSVKHNQDLMEQYIAEEQSISKEEIING